MSEKWERTADNSRKAVHKPSELYHDALQSYRARKREFQSFTVTEVRDVRSEGGDKGVPQMEQYKYIKQFQYSRKTTVAAVPKQQIVIIP